MADLGDKVTFGVTGREGRVVCVVEAAPATASHKGNTWCWETNDELRKYFASERNQRKFAWDLKAGRVVVRVDRTSRTGDSLPSHYYAPRKYAVIEEDETP